MQQRGISAAALDAPLDFGCVAQVDRGKPGERLRGRGKWLAAPEVIEIAPIDVRVALALTGLPATLPSDPADRLIVATARAS
jgi:hypothetical protein